MFRPFQRTDGLYYVGLVFMVFPLAGTIWFGYPMWTLAFSVLFVLAYILTIHIRNQYPKTIACLWFYMLAYIVSMCFLEGSMVWFFFFLSNLLVWRFGDDLWSYRMLSYMIGLLLVTFMRLLFADNLASQIMSILIPIFVVVMHYFQRQNYMEDKIQKEIYQKNKEINLLTAENERNRIGRDLHDTLGHTFAMMSLKTELALKQMEKGQYDAVQKQLVELNQISHSSMHEVRELVNHLKYRTVAEELTEMERLFGLSDIAFTIKNEIDMDSLAPVIQSTMTMVLRELANNVIKHSQADDCQIIIRRRQGIELVIRDNGAGFDELTGEELHSIRERLSLVDGSVEVSSSANPTIVTVILKEGGRQ
ncbi:sensor histidine kinase [Streptococcus ratti]|uniref:histidine kinase n=1 Tax=Streptococcus ratti TaxID=1341 RepID=A0A7X9QHI7_STRRT|nr:sensor histidine kinase [Streptococcus ratti]NMD49225.1 sensor histidine kinase [Streptococcus ratti]